MRKCIQGVSRRQFLGGSVVFGAGVFLQACGGGDSENTSYVQSAVIDWNTLLLQAITDTKSGPPMTARAIGMVHTAIYDAWAAYSPSSLGTQLGDQLRQPVDFRTQTNKEVAIAFAAYRVLVDLYPTRVSLFDAQMKKLNLNPANTSADTSTPTGVGNVVAKALLDFRHNDGSNQLGNLAPGAYADYTGYVPTNTPDLVRDPSEWQQLRFVNGASPSYIGAHWGRVTPFSLTSSAQFRPAAPPVFGTAAYLAEAKEVIDTLASITEEQKVIAEYWADGPASVLPPGHWMLFAQVVAARDRNNLDKDVKLFFLMGNAVMDVSIATWEAKRFYNASRPYTAIRNLFAGQKIASFAGPDMGVKLVDGAQWMPYQPPNFITPPFPEYTSGHSAFSTAGAEILRRFTESDSFNHGQDIAAGWSTFEKNIPQKASRLSWSTFTEAADQAGLSRIYGGIHFNSGDMAGRTLGRLVGAAVWTKGTQLFGE